MATCRKAHLQPGVSVAFYLNDPDRNGVELYWDRPKDQWPTDKDGNLQHILAGAGAGALGGTVSNPLGLHKMTRKK